MRRTTLAFVLLLFAPFLRGAQWSRPALLTESLLEPAGVSEDLKIATDGEIILGAWGGADFGGSLFIQRWTIEGDLLEPTPRVIHHGRDGLFESAYAYAPRVDDVIWTGTEFLVVWSNDKTVVIDTIDRELRHTTRNEIAFAELPRFVRATAREILMIRGTTAEFYTTSGKFISSIPLVIPGSSVEALDAASDGERFLLSGVFSNGGDVSLYTIAIHSNRSASQAVIVPLDTWSWYYAIDVTYGAERFLVTTVYSGHTGSDNAAIKLYSFDRLGKHLRTSLFYNPPYGGGASAPEVLWNGLEFEMYWLPPENPVLARSMVSEEGVVRHTSAIALDDPTYVLPRVIQSGSMRTFVWRKNDRLLIDHRPAGENVLSGTPATWRTQTELMPQTSSGGTRSLVLWYEPRARQSAQSGIEFVPRAMAIDHDGSRALVQLPPDACEANALASNETETVMVFSCGAGLRAARLPADTHTFSESDEIVTGNDIRITPQALTWNGSGWTVVWTTRDGSSQSGFVRRVRMLRLAPDLTPTGSPISLEEIHELDGAYISSNGTSEIIVTAQVDPEACYILCTGPPAHPVEMLKLGGDGRIIDRWTALEAGGFTAVPLTIVPDAGGFFLVVGAREVNVVRVTGNAPLADATVSRFGLAALSLAATVQGEHLWIAITEASYQWISDGLPIHLYRADLAGGTTKLAEEWSLGGYAGSVTLLERPNAVPGLISSEMTPDPAQGLSPRILLRELERSSRRRAVSHR